MNELALFAGAGGGILGGKLLGWRTVCAVERDAYAAQVLAQRQNDGCLEPFPVWSDVQSFDGRPWRGVVDVVSGGFPCQDISCAGKGAGLNGERSGLWAEMARIIGEVEPKHAFIENSPMLVTRGLATVLSDLDAMGFDAEWGCVGAHAVGAPHKRERLWIVATHPKRVQEREEPRCGEIGRMGREFKSLAWDRDWKDAYTSLRGMGNGLARAVDRTDAIRNGQVPAVAAAAWRLLTANAK
jgi:DNA (cytosine-5)-methyltransferase 1